MTRLLVRLVGLVALGCMVVVGLALLLGHMLPPENELLFTSTFDGKDLEIYRMSIQHNLIAPITRNSFDEFQAGWSPDGEQIVFVSNRNGASGIYRMDAQGSHVSRLIEGQFGDYSPVWSPDGQSIAFITDRYSRSRELMLLDIPTRHIRRLTDNENLDNNPTWSPDSQHIVFNVRKSGASLNHIYLLDVQSGTVMPIVVTYDDDLYPIWSPDGRYIVFLKGMQTIYFYVWDAQRETIGYLYNATDVIPSTLSWSLDSRLITYSIRPSFGSGVNTLYALDVGLCLQDRKRCAQQRLVSIDSFFTNTRWRPTPP